MTIAKVVCSNKPKSFKGVSGSNTHHIAIYETTYCGRDASEWFIMEMSLSDALQSAYCCKRCAANCGMAAQP